MFIHTQTICQMNAEQFVNDDTRSTPDRGGGRQYLDGRGRWRTLSLVFSKFNANLL